MTDWIFWFAMAGVLVILEIFTGTFYLLMIAIGMAAGGIAALAGVDTGVQLLCAALVGIAATAVLRNTRLGRPEKRNAARDPNVNLDIGQSIDVPEWQTGGPRPFARVHYRGAQWDAELAEGEPVPGAYVIREIRGSRLIVAGRAHAHSR